jgi:hypothetical protein
MQNDNFTWFGMYNFGHSEIEDMMDACDPQMQKLHGMLCEILHSDYDISGYDEQKRFTLAQLAQKGFVRVEGKRAIPNFCVFTEEQYARLQEEVFDPIAAKLETVTRLLVADLEECCRAFSNRLIITCSINMASMGIIIISSGIFACMRKSGWRRFIFCRASPTTSSTISFLEVIARSSFLIRVTVRRFSVILLSQLESS